MMAFAAIVISIAARHSFMKNELIGNKNL